MKGVLISVGTVSVVCFLWAGSVFKHTSESDWTSGTSTGINTSTYPGDVILADDISNPEFHETFDGTSYNGDSWTTGSVGLGAEDIIVLAGVCSVVKISLSPPAKEIHYLRSKNLFSLNLPVFVSVDMDLQGVETTNGFSGSIFLCDSVAGGYVYQENSFLRIRCLRSSGANNWIVSERDNGGTENELFNGIRAFKSGVVRIRMGSDRLVIGIEDEVIYVGVNNLPFQSFYVYLETETNDDDSHEVVFDNLKVMKAKYSSVGELTNVVDLSEAPITNGTLRWGQSVSDGNSIKFQTRTSANGSTGWSDWSSYYTRSSGENIASPPNRYLQYRALLSTTDTDVTPRLHDVTFDFELKGSLAKENVYNYPNPFSPAEGPTNLSFSVGQSSAVELAILTATGKRVWHKGLTAAEVLAGENVVTWDGKDSSGKLVPNGVYLYVVEAEGRKVINKIAVVR